MTPPAALRSAVSAACLFMILLCSVAAADDERFGLPAGMAAETALRLGERMYRQGILPSGGVMQAVVTGDVPVDGSMVTCVSCHQRSGVGTLEGSVITPPITGPRLYAPLLAVDRLRRPPTRREVITGGSASVYRPAYTDETLARVLRWGVDPAGRRIHGAMPLYALDDSDMAVLVYYLRRLSGSESPGVSDTTIRLATVVTEEVSAVDRAAMLGALESFVSVWNRLQPMKAKGPKAGEIVDTPMYAGYRRLSLSPWVLKGPVATWQAQLAAYYEKEPVFALVGGITTLEWEPVHRFCEGNRLPSILPLTDLPFVAGDDWYSLYFSKGLYQEGEAAARFLHGRKDLTAGASIMQFYRDDARGRALARGFSETWGSLGNGDLRELPISGADAMDRVLEESGVPARGVILIWTDIATPSRLAALGAAGRPAAAVFVSSGLLGRRLYDLPASVRPSVYVTYPATLPQEAMQHLAAVESWRLQYRLPPADPGIQSRMLSLGNILTNALSMMMMRRYYLRDYLLELIDMMEDDVGNKATYPVLSFGQGQRYAAKGCYIVQLSGDEPPQIVPRSEWVIH